MIDRPRGKVTGAARGIGLAISIVLTSRRANSMMTSHKILRLA